MTFIELRRASDAACVVRQTLAEQGMFGFALFDEGKAGASLYVGNQSLLALLPGEKLTLTIEVSP